MLTHVTSGRSNRQRHSMLVLAFVVPVVLSWLAFTILPPQQAQQKVAATATQLQSVVSRVLRLSLALGQRYVSLAGQSCDDAMHNTAFTRDAAYSPYVRAMALVDQSMLYCSSARGAIKVPLPTYLDHTPLHPEYWLVTGTQLSPSTPALFIYIPGVGHRAMLVSLQIDALIDLLSATATPGMVDIELHDGNLMLRTDGSAVPANGRRLRTTAFTREQSLPGTPLTLRFQASEALIAHERLSWIWLLPLGLLVGTGAAYGLWTYWRSREPLRQSIEAGIRRNQFVPYYQPVIDLKSGRCTGAEMLARWQHPSEGLVAPDVFIPFAERTGAILPLTRKLMAQTARDLREMPLPRDFHLAVNLSASHFQDAALVEDILEFKQMLNNGIVIVLEITERQAVQVDDEGAKRLKQLHEAGIRFAIDDFGIGYSGLAYLEQFPLDILKIDRVFASASDTSTVNGRILLSIIDLAKRLGLSMVGEGIETERQRQHLRECGVDFGQGHLLARPMPYGEFKEWMAQALLADTA
ncbi:MAG: EAL domain-containing protein [Janthinobacterium lividum]